jgi:poly-gamma-glutamate synthesis protein (capsule biosynthesis protein)
MKYAVFIVFIGVFCMLLFLYFQQNRIEGPLLLGKITQIAPKKVPLTTVLLGGDVMLGRSVTVEALDRRHDSTFPFKNLQTEFQSSDIIVLNLETPIVEDCPRRTTGMIFCAPEAMIEGLTPPSKILVNIANNHTANYGEAGLLETKQSLFKRGIAIIGSTDLVTKNINGTTFGFLGFDKDQKSNPTLDVSERNLIMNSKKQVDILIVSMHWGIEYNAHPTEGQKKLAKELVSLGANIVVGHHPHWVQDIEWIGTTPVYYSLGNLIFDQMWSEETKHGLLVKLTFAGKNIEKQELMPVYIQEIGQPQLR